MGGRQRFPAGQFTQRVYTGLDGRRGVERVHPRSTGAGADACEQRATPGGVLDPAAVDLERMLQFVRKQCSQYWSRGVRIDVDHDVAPRRGTANEPDPTVPLARCRAGFLDVDHQSGGANGRNEATPRGRAPRMLAQRAPERHLRWTDVGRETRDLVFGEDGSGRDAEQQTKQETRQRQRTIHAPIVQAAHDESHTPLPRWCLRADANS